MYLWNCWRDTRVCFIIRMILGLASWSLFALASPALAQFYIERTDV
jgi:hypothetical protein